MTDSGPSDANASASAGWHIGPSSPEPIPPEVLDLFAEGSFTLIEAYTLAAPAAGGSGLVAVTLRQSSPSRRAVLVALRDAQPPEVVYGTESRGRLTFRFEAGAHDDGARLLLLSVRADSAGPEPTVAPVPTPAHDPPRTAPRP